MVTESARCLWTGSAPSTGGNIRADGWGRECAGDDGRGLHGADNPGYPGFSAKAVVTRQAIETTHDAATYMVSYVGKRKHPQVRKHIREFWTETPSQLFPLFELSAANGNVYVSILQPFSKQLYYGALLEELEENGIPYTERGTTSVNVAEIRV